MPASMGFDDVLGHDRAKARLRAALEGGRLPHAWLFAGPEGVGKERLARRFAAALLCEASPREAPCRSCRGCERALRGVHPDFLVLLPEAERVARGLASRAEFERTPSRELKIAEVRQLERWLRLGPVEGRAKVALVLPADRLNQSAQNALLKTLEEPPPAATLLLVTSAAEALLPTVRSRCVRLPFAPLPPEVVAEHARSHHGCAPEAAAVLARLSGGSLGRVQTLDPETVETRRQLIERLRALRPGDGLGATRLVAVLAEEREEAIERLRLLRTWYRDVLAASVGASNALLIHADLAEAAREDAARLGGETILRRLAAIESAVEAIEANVTPRLAVEGMLASFGGGP
ncbi:MAG: DNA polymerase III subunit delta' [Deltaproteobacteria bacterium]|nr:MAG: DNA polymerase III subunit delta' [Deltaproteobacteria bacterium]